MEQYHDLLKDVLENGEVRGDRTGTGTISVFGRQARYDLREGFPCVTTKKLHLRSIIHELLWFLKGDTNISYLKENEICEHLEIETYTWAVLPSGLKRELSASIIREIEWLKEQLA